MVFASFLLFLTLSSPAATNTSFPRVESYRDLFSMLSLWHTWVVMPKSATIDCIPSPSAALSFCRAQRTRRLRSGPMIHDCAIDDHHSSAHRFPLRTTAPVRVHMHVHVHLIIVFARLPSSTSFSRLRYLLAFFQPLPTASTRTRSPSLCTLPSLRTASDLMAALLTAFDSSFNPAPSNNA